MSWTGESEEGPHKADLRGGCRLDKALVASARCAGAGVFAFAEVVHLAVVAILAEAGVGDAGQRVLAHRLDAEERRPQLVSRQPAKDGRLDRAVEVAGLLGGDALEIAGCVIARRAAGAAAHRLDQLPRVQVRLRVAGDALAD